MNVSKVVEQQYGQRLRMRVCGLCLQGSRLLLVQHKDVGPLGYLWSPPGGGMEFGSSAAENLQREFLEETGLRIEVGDFLFMHEYLNPPLHALELFFLVYPTGGTLQTGLDPEHSKEAQLIQHVSFVEWKEVKEKPAGQLHQILQHTSSLQDLISMRGYHKFSV
jgi:8-oxo-dGTP diphosphatase